MPHGLLARTTEPGCFEDAADDVADYAVDHGADGGRDDDLLHRSHLPSVLVGVPLGCAGEAQPPLRGRCTERRD